MGLSVCAFDVASATGGGGTLMDVARHRKTSLRFNQIHRITTKLEEATTTEKAADAHQGEPCAVQLRESKRVGASQGTQVRAAAKRAGEDFPTATLSGASTAGCLSSKRDRPRSGAQYVRNDRILLHDAVNFGSSRCATTLCVAKPIPVFSQMAT